MMADRTYHRVLQVDWIHADVDGDGVPQDVPRNDRLGPTEPQQIYSLSSPSEPESTKTGISRFYVGGNIYDSWKSAPESYKESNPRYSEPPSRPENSTPAPGDYSRTAMTCWFDVGRPSALMRRSSAVNAARSGRLDSVRNHRGANAVTAGDVLRRGQPDPSSSAPPHQRAEKKTRP